jgi:hypothetical protein
MDTKKQITNCVAKAVRNRIRDQVGLDLCPYPCEKRDESTVWVFCLGEEWLIGDGEGEVKRARNCYKYQHKRDSLARTSRLE